MILTSPWMPGSGKVLVGSGEGSRTLIGVRSRSAVRAILAPVTISPETVTRGADMRELLATTEHRPWPLPGSPWVMFQRWHELLFAHWPVAAEEVQRLLPPGLELELFEGQAWVGVVPFRMTQVRLRGTPALPWLSAFEELNVRTYVRHGELPGVWFFSLDARNPLAVRIARSWFHLPYFRARMRLEERAGEVHYRSERRHAGAPPAELRMSYAPIAPPERSRPGTLEHFLTERYRLYASDPQGALLAGDIHHRPWPLQRARARFELNTMAEASGIRLPASEPRLHFARELDVLIWPPRVSASSAAPR